MFVKSIKVLLLLQHGADTRGKEVSFHLISGSRDSFKPPSSWSSPSSHNTQPTPHVESCHSSTVISSPSTHHHHHHSVSSSHSLLKLSLLSRDLMTVTLLYAAGASADAEDGEERAAVAELVAHSGHSARDCRISKRCLPCFLCLR